jgi:hypothetical protein
MSLLSSRGEVEKTDGDYRDNIKGEERGALQFVGFEDLHESPYGDDILEPKVP